VSRCFNELGQYANPPGQRFEGVEEMSSAMRRSVLLRSVGDEQMMNSF
jgi:hypothetical protein